MIDINDLYQKTNAGLDIILHYYPQAHDCVGNKKPFKLRNENTASAYIKKFDKCYKVTDFGADSTAMSPIDVAMMEENLTTSEAIFKLADRHGLQHEYKATVNKPDIRKRPATDTEPDGYFFAELNDEFTKKELEIMGPRCQNIHMKKYGYHSVKSITRSKNGECTVISSNESFPIFMRQCGEFQKFYQPCNPDKAYRFFYQGDKPKDYINGLDELKRAFAEFSSKQDEEQEFEPTDDKKPRKPKKLPEAIICSGERDAMCIAALGYFPLWLNSETATLNEKDYKDIARMVEKLYNIPDLDTTGRERGIKLALQYIDIHTVWLPEWLCTYKDSRGKPRKDVRDYVELRPKNEDFAKLLNVAMPVRFWEIAYSKWGERYEINTQYLKHFLHCNGFATLENKGKKNGYMLVKIDKNVVTEVTPRDIKNYIIEYTDKTFLDVKIKNTIDNSRRISEAIFETIRQLTLDFTSYDHQSQLLFFKNETWEIRSDKTVVHKQIVNNKYVFADKVNQYNVRRKEKSFTIDYIDTDDSWNININNLDSNYMRFLINTSRVHWRQEMEIRTADMTPTEREAYIEKNKFDISGSLLTHEEREEQMQMLINKIFAVGYLLHRYKDMGRAWCTYLMDYKLEETVGDSNGRSGKSIFMLPIERLLNAVTLQGRNPRLQDNNFMFERVTEYTDMVYIDDAGQYLDFDYFFDTITGKLIVNPKHGTSFEIPFSKSPKLALTTNFVIRRHDPSTLGRLLFVMFSDYYHLQTDDNDYKESRQVSDDFGGRKLFDELYSDEAWNHDFNFIADCLEFYLSTTGKNIKINPPMRNISQRSLMANMGNNFHDWALVYFNEQSNNLNRCIPRTEAFDDYRRSINISSKESPQKFTQGLKAFCKKYGYRLNPDELKNNQGRIIRKVEDKTHEMIYVQTPNTEIDLFDYDTTNINDNEKPF